ncbi:MAG: DUF6933 domain-containing protein, partial [Acidimicrobiales bacterium]
SGALGDWYANVLFWRPQVTLFVNATTLLRVIVPFAPAASVLSRLPSGFAEVGERLGVHGVRFEAELASMTHTVLAKTASRSVLGTMNEFSHMADEYRWRDDEIDLIELSLWLARVPCRPLFKTYGVPEDALRALLS